MQVPKDDRRPCRHERARRVQCVSPEDRRGPSHRDVAEHAAPDPRDDAQKHRRAHPVAGVERFDRAGGRPRAHDEGVGDDEEAVPPFARHPHGKGDEGAQERPADVERVCQRDGRALLQQGVSQHPPAQSHHDGERHEADEVETLFARDHSAEHSGQDHSEDVEESKSVCEDLRDSHVRPALETQNSTAAASISSSFFGENLAFAEE